jgi:nitrate/TMAO reductase-like tetraheme cytochrome c subunit
MRNHLSRTTALAAAGVLTLSLSACGGSDESAQAFCDSFSSMDELTTDLQQNVDPSDPESAVATLEELTVEVESIEAPDEIADAYQVVSSAFRSFTDTMTEALSDPENADPAVLSEATSAFSSEEFSEANAEIEAYATENCS